MKYIITVLPILTKYYFMYNTFISYNTQITN